MDSSTSSLVSRLGGGSGVDMVKLASDLAEARYATQIARLESRNEQLEARVSAAAQLRGQFSQLASALGERIRTGDLSPQATIGSPAVAGVSVAPGASPRGSYSLEVTRLAQGQVLALPGPASAADPVGEGALTIRFGSVADGGFTADSGRNPLEFTVAAGETLEQVAARITAANAGVSAYVANGTNGPELVLKGGEGGASGFIVEVTNTGSAGPLDGLGWNPASDSGQLRQGAQDAAFLLDTVAMTSPTNRVTNLPAGIQLDLRGTNTGAPTTIGFADRSGQVAGVMGDLVAALNDIAGQVRALGDPQAGDLGSDPGLRALRSAFASLSAAVVMPNAATGEPRTLGDLGLSLNRDGSFRLDSDRLNRTLTESPQGAAAMFTTGLFGVFATVDRLARTASSRADPGSLAGSEARYSAQLQRNADALDKIAEQQERLRERMTREFVSADTRVASSNSTLSFLRTQIDMWTARSQ
ncbi:flagellar filament capping protein FliD [Altererythrobacter sp. H2]|uniref:flagellar filament capping protein FliD n=1 Tax=Altererythrobacter sp. H2 TaxID=3108391 RepID=UPI002B4C03D5|nr:flagellar filament capping protein FliD [Altererythrobacter sp. H2]WRK96966.1 flagellar filament capping protein FliD [Altererythrobacter sp. H2]